MRNKSALIPVVLIALVGIVFASVEYFPSTGSLPREPKSPGTIGGVLYSLFAPDGTAKNTEKLGGITATGYLHSSNCTDPINKKWTGVDADGKGICGNPTSLYAIGKFNTLTPGVQVMKNGSSTWTPANTTDTLYPGDKIATNGGTATIDFTLDASLLRLDTGTTLELRLGNLDGNSVAEAILSDGRLWGRILTSTGVNLGGGGIVAGVRGTSVSVEQDQISKNLYKISIVDSQKPSSAAFAVANNLSQSISDSTSGTIIRTNNSSVLTAYSQVNAYSGNTNPSIYAMEKSQEYLINSSTWIRDNTKLDIDYLYANSGAETIIKNEYNITLPPSISTDVLTALCSREEGGTNMNIYWKSLVGTLYNDKCRSSNLVALAEYDKGLSLYFSGTGVTASGGSTNDITGTGKYLAYNSLPVSLTDKTLKIEIDNPIPTSTIKKYILEDPTTSQIKIYKQNNIYYCLWVGSIDGFKCNNIVKEENAGKIILITLPNLNRLVIGNLSTGVPPYSFPIGVKITGISIQ